MKLFTTLVAALALCFGCSVLSKTEWKVGVDPTWYPLKLGRLATPVTAFSTELLTAIGAKEDLALTKVTVSWDDLMDGLHKEEYNAILSSMPPYLFNQKDFEFSDLYLALGPVLMVSTQSDLDAFEDLDGKEIGVVQGSSYDLLLQKKEGAIVRYFDSIPDMLNSLVQGSINGALVGNLHAAAYLRDLYQNTLKIVTPPLTQEGLRLITKKSKAKKLIESFNEGLKKMKEDNDYKPLLEKWSLPLNNNPEMPHD